MTYDISYLKDRVAKWKKKYCSAQRDEAGCIISTQVATNGYARITLSQGKKADAKRDQWHAPAYTVIAFVDGKLPLLEELSKTKHPVASHLCGRGAKGCASSEHIVFGESQKVNINRSQSGCNMIVECETCHTVQIGNRCKGHTGSTDVCVPSPLKRKAPAVRLQEVNSAIKKLKHERQELLTETQALIVNKSVIKKLF